MGAICEELDDVVKAEWKIAVDGDRSRLHRSSTHDEPCEAEECCRDGDGREMCMQKEKNVRDRRASQRSNTLGFVPILDPQNNPFLTESTIISAPHTLSHHARHSSDGDVTLYSPSSSPLSPQSTLNASLSPISRTLQASPYSTPCSPSPNFHSTTRTQPTVLASSSRSSRSPRSLTSSPSRPRRSSRRKSSSRTRRESTSRSRTAPGSQSSNLRGTSPSPLSEKLKQLDAKGAEDGPSWPPGTQQGSSLCQRTIVSSPLRRRRATSGGGDVRFLDRIPEVHVDPTTTASFKDISVVPSFPRPRRATGSDVKQSNSVLENVGELPASQQSSSRPRRATSTEIKGHEDFSESQSASRDPSPSPSICILPSSPRPRRAAGANLVASYAILSGLSDLPHPTSPRGSLLLPSSPRHSFHLPPSPRASLLLSYFSSSNSNVELTPPESHPAIISFHLTDPLVVSAGLFRRYATYLFSVVEAIPCGGAGAGGTCLELTIHDQPTEPTSSDPCATTNQDHPDHSDHRHWTFRTRQVGRVRYSDFVALRRALVGKLDLPVVPPQQPGSPHPPSNALGDTRPESPSALSMVSMAFLERSLGTPYKPLRHASLSSRDKSGAPLTIPVLPPKTILRRLDVGFLKKRAGLLEGWLAEVYWDVLVEMGWEDWSVWREFVGELAEGAEVVEEGAKA
ncbi:hypothetical protein M427DRAFT_41849 [Gonapodya prolifera JEL478]|uniref:PX domain-containing protein n=1 Tax=Gonapodya prolifera (strain JEL478) TaxID=1344416 RepID=A0A139ARY6_GONPJ|nr:hypothetical protein M427DRAFT_41849 [Gonapodya prolifera JEL478]|eukprot:KXS19507.1 hypothetical protein M427DRAFT_41849 [Gonapodya prolifera JEL478]